jgi:predicted phosphodiesterase
MYRILHLSDLHFGADHGLKPAAQAVDLAQAVSVAVQNDLAGDTRLDALVLSGDFFSAGASDNLPDATEGLKRLQESLGVSSDAVFCVPGNHDVSRGKSEKEKLFFFDQLLQNLHGVRSPSDAYPVVRVIAPALNAGGPRAKKPLAIVLLNSCHVEGERFSGIGLVGDQQHLALEPKLKAAGVTPKTHLIIAVLHHHLLPIVKLEVDSDEPFKASLTADASEVLRQLTKLGTSVVLHGHQHVPAILEYRNHLDAPDPPSLFVCAAGSCGSKRASRHFFLYELGDETLRVKSFRQSDDNARSFVLGEQRLMQIKRPAPPPPPKTDGNEKQAPDVCNAARKEVNFSKRQIDPQGMDLSDLFLLFLSVKSGHTSRELIRALADDPKAWKRVQPQYFKLSAMYELSGKWDLAVRFRAPAASTAAERAYFETITETLRENGQFGNQKFRLKQAVNVTREAPGLSQLLVQPPPPVDIRRVRLPSTVEYERRRCERGFLFIYLPEESNLQDEFFRALERDVAEQERRWAAEQTGSIIECCYRSEHELVIETFSRCSQSWHMNQLNRAVEKTVADFDRQKYTLTCYEYDERESGFPLSAHAPK